MIICWLQKSVLVLFLRNSKAVEFICLYKKKLRDFVFLTIDIGLAIIDSYINTTEMNSK